MNENDLKKGIESWKKVRLGDEEKKLMLTRIMTRPVRSTFMHMNYYVAFASCLLIAFVSIDMIRASGNALPGDTLYSIKTQVVEPVIGALNSTPEEKLVWEEEKINRRITEAEALVEKDKLDEKKLETLKKSIEKSSKSFAQAADVVASSTTVSTTSAKEKAETLKSEFRKKITEEKKNQDKELRIEEVESVSSKIKSEKSPKKEGKEEKIKRLKEAAIKALDEERESKEED